MTYFEVTTITKKWKILKKPPVLKPASDFKFVGKDFIRNDLLPKVKGEAVYSIDGEFPGMLYAVFVKPPFLQAEHVQVDATEAKKINGFVRLIVEQDFIAVVALNRYAAEMSARKLSVKWSFVKNWSQKDIIDIVTVGKGRKREVMKTGNVNRALRNAEGQVFEFSYRTPAASHAQMEPNGTIASVEGDTCRIIAGVQVLPKFQKKVAELLGYGDAYHSDRY